MKILLIFQTGLKRFQRFTYLEFSAGCGIAIRLGLEKIFKFVLF